MLTCEWNSNPSDTSCLLKRKFEKEIKYKAFFLLHIVVQWAAARSFRMCKIGQQSSKAG